MKHSTNRKLKRLLASVLSLAMLIPVLSPAVSAESDTAPQYTIMDVDENDEINIFDALLVIDKVLEKSELSETQLLAADCDFDGGITILDIFEILEYLSDPELYVAPTPPTEPSEPVEPSEPTEPAPFISRGIDVSAWQGAIDWNAVKAAGVDYVIIRAGFGKFSDQIDKYFEANYAGAKAAGLGVGAYHYSYAVNVQDAKQEAQVALGWLAGKQFDYPIYFDMEYSGQTKLSRATNGEIIDAYCSTLEAAGYFTGLYSYSYFLNTYVPNDIYKEYTIWDADVSNPSPTYTGKYDMWQYSHSSSVSGIAGNVDANLCYRNFPEVIKRLGFNGYPGETVKSVG